MFYGYYAMYPSFNILMTIDNINTVIDDMLNSRTVTIKIPFVDKYPSFALYEFNETSKTNVSAPGYTNYIDNGLNDINTISQRYGFVLDVLKSGSK